jgi:diguanylate cyclase (GGDEF)-like protein
MKPTETASCSQKPQKTGGEKSTLQLFSQSRLFRLFFRVSALTIEGVFLLLFITISVFAKQIIDQREKNAARSSNLEMENMLDLWLHSHISDISMLKTVMDIRRADETPYFSYLSALVNANKDFSDVFIANPDGTIYVSTTAIESVKTVNIADRDYFRNVQNEKVYISGFFRDRVKKEHFIAISTKIGIGNNSNTKNGVLVGLIPSSAILSYLKSIHSSSAVMNVIILSGDFKSLSNDPETGPTLPASIFSGLQDANTYTAIYTNRDGDKVYGTASRLTDFNLVLITEVIQKKALTAYYTIQLLILVFAGITITLILILVYGLTRRMLKPIQILSDAAIDIAHGKPAAVLDLKTGTELDSIGLCFNFMSTIVSEREFMLREAIARDSLTGLYNHGRIMEFLAHEIVRQTRNNTSISFIMIDIDFFKHVNDKYGHQAGDYILKEVSALLANSVREADILGRYGGEEFSIIVSDEEEALIVALCERIRKKTEETVFRYEETEIGITISLGYCYAPASHIQPDMLIRAADHALYTAKATGRNRVCAAPLFAT